MAADDQVKVNNSLKTIVGNLGKARTNYKEAKKTAVGWAERIGSQEEELGIQEEVWRDLEKVSGKVLSPLAASGEFMSKDVLNQSFRLRKQMDDGGIDDSTSTAGTAITTLTGVAGSVVNIAYPQDSYPQSYQKLKNFMEHSNEHEVISKRLREINPVLADQYDNAWQSLNVAVKDKTRSPMFLIRAVINGLFDQFAPKPEVRECLRLEKKGKVTKRHRVDFIAGQIEDPLKRQTFLNQKEAFVEITNLLSKAKKPGELDEGEARAYLYQANGLIKLLLDSFA